MTCFKVKINKILELLQYSLCIFLYPPPQNGIRGHLSSFVLSVCDSVAKKINLGHNFWPVKDRGFIFHMHTQLMKPFQMTPMVMTLWPWPWSLTLKRGRAFIFHMYISCDEAFPIMPKVWTSWPWSWPLTYISKQNWESTEGCLNSIVQKINDKFEKRNGLNK